MRKYSTRRWSNMHGHLRQTDDEDALMTDIIEYALRYKYFTAMSNIKPPIKRGADAVRYELDIFKTIQETTKVAYNEDRFMPIIPLKFLWDNSFQTTPEIIEEAHRQEVQCAKLYIIGTTTNSDDGVALTNIPKLYPTFAKMEELGMLLLIHGEVPGDDIDMKDREYLFGKNHLPDIVKHFPKLKIVEEHITDHRMVEIIMDMPDTVAATVTTHHLYMTQNNVLEPGPRPVNACKPYAKFMTDRAALIAAVLSGNPKFFFGDDTAAHRTWKKYMDCGMCGCFHTHSMEFITQFFADHDALDKLENFAAVYGPQFYGLPVPTEIITMEECEPYFIPRLVGKNKDIEAWGFDRQLRWKLAQ